MKTLFILATVMAVLFLAAPDKVEAQKKKPAAKVIVGVISDYSCGDNCYLTITDSKGKAHQGLCTAPICAPWNEVAEMPDSYKGKRVRVTVGKGLQLYGNGEVFGNFPAFRKIEILTVPQAGNTFDAAAFYGVWEYIEDGAKRYLKITNAGMGKFRLNDSFLDLAGEIDWVDAEDIYLKIVNGRLTGRFVSANFRPTHGHDFTYKITCELKSSNRMTYSLWSQNGITDRRVATKISN